MFLEKKWNSSNSIDYVGCWYKKTADYIKDTDIKCAFVSTNSIIQGEQATALWKPLFEEYGMQFDFAYQTFVWDSEATDKAHVHCVIIGFSLRGDNNQKELYTQNAVIKCDNINQYLFSAPSIFITRSENPICTNVPKLFLGCTFNDTIK